ncbi:MAG: DUF2846 domain-containing protein [Gammaproteobacteria bacterium]|nr:DUF2846 domain-containing protein [Gammaproteobacteria bacterium]
MIFYKSHIVLLMIYSLVACSTEKKQFILESPADPEGSTVYIYRPHSLSNIVVSPILSINGKNKIAIKNDHYTYIHLPPGKHVFQLELDEKYQGKKRLQLLLEPASQYYIKVNTALKFEKNKPYSRTFSMQRIEQSQALDEIEQCGYMEAKIPSRYLWSENSSEDKSDPAVPVRDAEFDLEKSRDPFSKLK